MPRSPYDPEIEELFGGEPELLDTARRLRASRPDPVLDPRFKAVLRARLMREADTVLKPRRRWFTLRTGHLAWASGAVGAVAIAALVVTLLHPVGSDHTNFGAVALASSNASAHFSPQAAMELSFNQPMDQHAVEAGVHITPATQVSFSWPDPKTLKIVPAHALAGDTPYTVTVPQADLRSATGQTAPGDLHLTFGTAPTPTPVPTPPAGPPALQPVTLGPVGAGGSVLFAGDGHPASTQAQLPVASPTPAATASAGPAPGSATAVAAFAEFTAPNTSVRISGPVDAAAFSPGGQQVAFAVAPSGTEGGGDSIVVAGADGSNPVTLTTASATVTAIAWSSASTIDFLSGDTVHAVDLQHRVTTVANIGDSGVLAPGGHWAFSAAPVTASPAASSPGASPATSDGVLTDLANAQSRGLEGSASGVVAFSGDGRTVAWVDKGDGASATRRLLISSTSADTMRQVPTDNAAGDRMPVVALSQDGGEVAYLVVQPDGNAHLVVARTDSGAVLATLAGSAQSAVFAPGGSALALVVSDGSGGANLELASLPGNGTATPAPVVPVDATAALDRFVDAQVSGDTTTLGKLSNGVDATSLTPQGLSRGYVISTSVNGDGTVAATARLIIDPPNGSTVTHLTDETLTLTHAADGSWQVSALVVPPLSTETPGPHVVHVGVAADAVHTIVTIAFDSDLDPATATAAVRILHAGKEVSGAHAVYDPAAREVTVTLPLETSGKLTVRVTTALTDIDGQSIAAAYQTVLAL